MDYLDSEGLTYYDSKIKGYTNDIIETSVLPMIPKKGVVAEGNNGYVTGGQVYSVMGGGGGSGEGKYPFSYIKFGKCRKLMLQSVSYAYLTGSYYHRYYRKGLADILDVKFYDDSLYYYPYYTITASSNETNTNYIAIGKEFIKDTMKPVEDDPYILNPLNVGQELDVSIRYSEFNGGLLDEPSSTSYESTKYFKGNKALDVIAESMELHNYTNLKYGWMYTSDHSFNVSNLFIYDNLKFMDEYAIISTPYIYIYAVQPPVIQVNSFAKSSLIKEIHVPSVSLDLYKSANNWSACGDYMIGDL